MILSCLLLVDNFPAHIHAASVYSTTPLSGVRVVILPKNTTSKLQPCGQEVVPNLQAGYRKWFVFGMMCQWKLLEISGENWHSNRCSRYTRGERGLFIHR